MSSNNAQTNGRKSSNSSAVNTPASTPVTNGNSQSNAQSTPPPNNNAPKYGTLVPNRIFVGGISANTTEGELLQLFSNYGTVKAAKIIQDRAGVSKGYGFITFESEDDAKRPLKDADNIVLRERKLNIAPAIKKQPFNRAFDASSPSSVAPGNSAPFYFPPNAGMPYFPNGITYYQQTPTAPGDPNSQPPAVYQAPPVYPAQSGPPQAPTYPSMMFPHHIYMPQQYAMPPMPYDYNYYPTNGGPQFMVGAQNGPSNGGGGGGGATATSQGGQMPPSTSPPRPPCYNTQLPQYPPEPFYYNVPVYGGGPLDGAPIYAESLDLAGNGGVYPEVSHIVGDPLIGFEGATDAQGQSYTLAEPSVHDVEQQAHDIADSQQQNNHHNHNHHHHPPPQQPPVLNAYESSSDVDGARQTNTPVVSLLSMEQHLEKDFVSMQGGRRVKQPQPQPPQQPQMLQHYPPPLFHYNYNGPSGRTQIPHHHHHHHHQYYNNNNNKTANNNNTRESNGWRKPRGYNNGATRKYDNTSRASLRTDSNSSANAVDDEKTATTPTATATPIESPVHSYYHHSTQQHMFNFTRTYQNSATRRGGGHPGKSTTPDNNNKSKGNFVQQMRPNGNNNGGQPQPPTTILSAARRGKRTTRRSVQGGGGSLGEIGAGDAPLPNNDVADACKKLETLKM